MKDVFLLVPALVFLFSASKMHQLFSSGMRLGIIGAVTAGIFLYCVSNYHWNLPHTDFRPFKESTNVAEEKAKQDEAINNITVVAYKVTDKETGSVREIPYKQYLKEYKNFPDSLFNKEQVKSEPEAVINKISEFDVTDAEGYPQTEDILNEQGFSFMVVAYKLDGKSKKVSETVIDTVYTIDTIQNGEELELKKVVGSIDKREISVEKYDWNPNYLSLWKDQVNPVLNEAASKGLKVYGITGPSTASTIQDFQEASNSNYPIYTADDILLKTIIRSNPGVLLWHNGTIVKKWHIKKFPKAFGEISAKYGIE